MAVQNNATVQMVRDLISGDINLPLYAAKGGKLVPVSYDGTSWTAISGYTAQVNVGDVALVLALASSANWGTNQLGDLRVITAVSTSLTLSETLLGNIFGAGGRYRVGDIVISENETSPAEAYGGSWEQITDRFLVGAGGSYALDSTGGNATHTNTVDEMAPHNHGLPVVNGEGGYMPENSAKLRSFQIEAGTNNNQMNINGTATDRDPTGFSGSVGSTGGGQPFSILPPYIAVNIWRRVA